MNSRTRKPQTEQPVKAQPVRRQENGASTGLAHGQHPEVAFQRVLRLPASALTPGDVLTLQRAIGNRAVSRLLLAGKGTRWQPAGQDRQTVIQAQKDEGAVTPAESAGPEPEKSLSPPRAEQTEAENVAEGQEPWWKLRAECRIGLEEHSLYFIDKQGRPELVINPNPQYLSEFLPRLKTALENKQVSQQTMEAYGELVRMVGYVQKVADSKDKDKNQQITSLLRQVAKLLDVVGDAADVGGVARPPSRIKFNSTTDRHGNEYSLSTEAFILSAHPGNSPGGSPPVEKSTWGAISARHPSFVRGHMLNKHLHGPGTADNLTPLTNDVNLAMSKAVEEHLKGEILERNRVYQYIIEVEYDGHAPKEGYSDWELEVIPTRIICTWQRFRKEPGTSGSEESHWELEEPRASHPITQVLPETKEETQRGKKRGPQLLGQFLADPNKRPTTKSKVQKEMYNLAHTGQKTLEQMFARQMPPPPQQVMNPPQQVMNPPPQQVLNPPPQQALNPPPQQQVTNPPRVVDEAIRIAVRRFTKYVTDRFTPKMTEEAFDDLLAHAHAYANVYYRRLCQLGQVDGTPWADTLQEQLGELEAEMRA